MNLEALNDIPLIWDKLSAQEKRLILAELDAIEDELTEWKPLPGPQTQAYHSKADILFYGGSAGSGKLLALDTPIPTINGWTTMGEITTNDVLFDEKGNTCNVVVVEPVTTDITYRLTFSDGVQIVAGASHKWLTETLADRNYAKRRTEEFRANRRSTRKSRGTGKRPDVALKNSLKKHNYLEPHVPTVKTTQEIVDTLYRGKRVNHSIRVCNPLVLPAKDLLIDPYVLGAWLGDGSSKAGQITGLDNEIFEEIRKAGFIVTDHAEIKSKGILKISSLLKDLGVYGNKHIPGQYLRGSIEQRLALLQGLMDTDGYCDPDGHCEFTNTNKLLAEQTHELISSLGIKVVLSTGVAKLNGLEYGPKYRLLFLTDLPVFRLSRKLNRQQRDKFRGTHTRRYILSAERIDPVPMRCIAVDSPSHLYLATKSFIPTHNTDLLLGLAHKAHYNSIIFRREYKQLRGIVERGKELIDKRNKGKFNKVDYVWRTNDERTIELGACKDLGDEEKFQGIPHDLKGFDEITHFYEQQFRFLCGWLRSVRQGQRTRIICTGNPPTTSDGDWVIRYWAAWLDKKHPNPAKPGELRWYTTIDGKEVELMTGDIIHHKGEIIKPESRSFIPGKIDDNPYLLEAGYKARLQALPEPLRSKMLFGDFSAGREDDAWQIIPTEWVHIAQARWEARSKPEMLMTTLGVDVARGGADMTILSPRYGNYYDKQKEFAGSSTPDGPMVAGQVLSNINYGTQVNVDVIGVGSSVYDILMSHNLNVDGINGASGSEATDKTGFFGFINRRAELWWKFREALDPADGQEICLPPGNELLADLCTPRYKVTTRGIQVESKEEIINRIGRSPDRGDSIVYASAEKQSGISFAVLR